MGQQGWDIREGPAGVFGRTGRGLGSYGAHRGRHSRHKRQESQGTGEGTVSASGRLSRRVGRDSSGRRVRVCW